MNYKRLKPLLFIFSLLILLSSILAGSFFIQGYHMYKEATSTISIEDKIAEIQTASSYVPLDQISQDFLAAIVSVEDHRFYDHSGLDLISTSRALIVNLLNGEITLGGSTITQQLAKNMFFSFEKTYTRKIAELIVAIQLEHMLSKNDILELYCNIIYFGNGYYGIEEASQGYFGVPASKLTNEQAIQLAGTPKSPNAYNPLSSKELVQSRSQVVIQALLENNYISELAISQLER